MACGMIGFMKKTFAALIVICALSGCQSEPTPTATPEPPASPGTAEPTTGTAQLVLAPGRVGPVLVGMPKAEAIETGLMVAGSEPPVDGCPTPPLLWKPPHDKQLDVKVDMDGNVASIGTMKDATIKTAAGVGLGTTLAEVQDAYPEAADPKDAGYGQSGVIVTEGKTKHLGFLFNPPAAKLTDDDEVTFIEITEGEEPALIRDGC